MEVAEKKKYNGKYVAKPVKEKGWFWKGLLALVLVIASVFASIYLLETVLYHNSDPGKREQARTVDYAVMDRYDMSMTNAVANVLDGIVAIERVYWLSDDDLVAPQPNPAFYGETDDPSTLQWLLDDAKELLDGQTTYFSTETEIIPGTKVTYYLDETILVISWKEEYDRMCYTVSEIKIAHPSQLRRFLAGGEYGSAIQLTTSEMADSVNAVVASAGDFYKYRRAGIVVYDGKLQRMDGFKLDTCFVDDQGNMLLKRADELTTEEEVNQFIEENNIRFSLSFGPILIRDGVRCETRNYPVGQVSDKYSRSGMGQRGELHYFFTAANRQFFGNVPNIYEFSVAVERFGCDQFYTLDGGQTATIVMNDQLVNAVDYGSQRQISDIIYFATAVPEGG